VVDTLARDLIYFSGSMPFPRFRATPALVIVAGMVAAALLVAISPMARAGFQAGCPASGPCPSPTPTHASIVLNVAAGGARANIGVTGSLFPPSTTVTLYWDSPSQVVTSTQTDSDGSLATTINPFPGSGPGTHSVCASSAGLNQAPPCATFTQQGAPTPTPPASPSPSAAPTGSPSPTSSPSASPAVLTQHSGSGGLDVITKPPLVFLPIIALLALLAALAYWVLMRGDRTPVLPSASVVHRSARPDIGPVAPRPPPTPPAPPVDEIQPPPADLPPPPAPFDPTEADPPAGPPETPEPPPY
jgi:hypothetical protein